MTSERLLQLLSLLRSRDERTGPELARILGVTERTVRRDVERIRALGYTVDSTTGSAGGYRLGHGTGVPPLLLTTEEAVAVAVALRGAAVTGLAGLEDTALQASLKLEQSLPAAARRGVQVIGGAVLAVAAPGPRVEVEVLVATATAVRDHRRIRVGYTTHGGRSSTRVLEPHRVVRVADRWFVLAWDLDADAWRTLRLDRVAPRPQLGETFDIRSVSDLDVRAAVADGITSRPYRYRARLTTEEPIDRVGAAVGPTRARIGTLASGLTELVGGGESLPEMARWIAGLPFEVTVHEPAELLPYLRDLSSRLSRIADRMAPSSMPSRTSTAASPGRRSARGVLRDGQHDLPDAARPGEPPVGVPHLL